MNNTRELIVLAKRIQALSENGQHYSENDYDLDRYQELDEISRRIIVLLTKMDPKLIDTFLPEKNGYRTPKVDVRAVVFNDSDQILMVREKIDGKWSLPGGWADIGYTPTEIAEKETHEEAGMKVKAKRVLAVLDKKCYDHPEDLYYAYKIFIECDPLDKNMKTGFETLDVGFFSLDELPELSKPRNTADQIKMMFEFRAKKRDWPHID